MREKKIQRRRRDGERVNGNEREKVQRRGRWRRGHERWDGEKAESKWTLIRRLTSYVIHKHQFPSPSTLCSALYFQWSVDQRSNHTMIAL